MSDFRTLRPEDNARQPKARPQGELRTRQANIRKGLEGYTVTLTMRENGGARVLVEKTVESYHEAETVARAFAAQQGFPWNKVALVIS